MELKKLLKLPLFIDHIDYHINYLFILKCDTQNELKREREKERIKIKTE